MRRHYKNALGISLILVTAFGGGLYLNRTPSFSERNPAAAGDWTAADFEKAHPAVTVNDFPQSRPPKGRSYFDYIFSQGDQYQVPFPFNKILDRLSVYSGQKINAADSTGIKATLFPMGRSLQRNAAVVGVQKDFSYDPFFRYPRAVVGFDDETTSPNELKLNLKNKFYIGYNERAEILEVISFNDQDGRYEYQLVKNYAAGKKPEVLYANRSLCLSCHQNQTPIFSRGPWSESNANRFVHEKLQATFDQVFGRKKCQNPLEEIYCYKAEQPFYFGLPIKVDLSVPYKFDTSTDQGNLIHSYQKMWTSLCPTVDCRVQFLRAAVMYKLTGELGVIPDAMMKSEFQKFEALWPIHFPNGLSIASPNIPNRDPFKDVVDIPNPTALQGLNAIKSKTVQELLTLSKVPSEFEPLQPRIPLDIWKNSGFDVSNTNRLIRGLALEFTNDDLKWINQGLLKKRSAQNMLAETQSLCQIDPDGSYLAITCENKEGKEAFAFNAYIKMTGSQGQGPVSEFKITSQTMGCDPNVNATDENIFSGRSCPQAQDLMGGLAYTADKSQLVLILQNQAGLNYHTLHGYEASEIWIDLKTKTARLKIFNSMNLMSDSIKADLASTLQETYFSRFNVMKKLMAVFKMNEVKIQADVSQKLALSIDGEDHPGLTEPDILAQYNGFQLMQKVCSSCHQNDEGVPPNFMGSKISPLSALQQCKQIETCAARILYRIKMRQCDKMAAQKKKNPMPPNLFFKNNPAFLDSWMKTHNPKIIQYITSLIDVNSLGRTISLNGVSAAEGLALAQNLVTASCPEANSVIYEQFPKCEFDQLAPASKCR